MTHRWNGEELLTLATWDRQVGPVQQRVTSWVRCELWKDGAPARTEPQIFSLLRFGLEEFRAMPQRAGFTGITVHGGYRAAARRPPPTRCGPSRPPAADARRRQLSGAAA
ncbi:hypothetical protein ACIHEI_36895 [Kitasatospora sp. NPDC051984]|uniref:hypothetical protein n=1 Tax=Kitasatospora sp. NPDC051984 TaxID=3364059 RepID=UPI0037C74DA2